MHPHLVLNHVPLVGGTAALLFLAFGLLRRSATVTVAGLFSVVLVGVAAVPVFLTGMVGQERIGQLPDLSRQLVERHQSAAVAATVGLVSTAAIAAAALVGWRGTRKMPRFAATAALIVGAAALLLAFHTATLGGQIRHSELQAIAARSLPPPTPAVASPRE